jgi:hypothetical protein
MAKMYSYEVFKMIEKELNLKLLKEYKPDEKYISTTKFCLTCNYSDCKQDIEINFNSLLKKKDPCCKIHMYLKLGDTLKKILKDKHQKTYDNNKITLTNLTKKVGSALIGDYDKINNETKITYSCCNGECNETGTKQYKTLIKNEQFLCHNHHYLFNNDNINEKKRIKKKETYDEYNDILNELKKNYPQINLSWDTNEIHCQESLFFNCINPHCKAPTSKSFQQIKQKLVINNEVFFGCENCKHYISKSLKTGAVLLINTEYYKELVELPKLINYITIQNMIPLKWSCGNKCLRCNDKHLYLSSPYNRFYHSSIHCPICINPNKCNCMADNIGFICSRCKEYFPSHANKAGDCVVCKVCNYKKKRCPNCIDWIDSRVGNLNYDGYCATCFKQIFPDDDRSKIIYQHTKEIMVRNAINKHFEGFVHDKPLYTGNCDCTHRRRVDHRKLIGNTVLAIETDEFGHRSYDEKDEEIRYDDLFMIHSGKWIYIRFNPDSNRDKTDIVDKIDKLIDVVCTQIKRIENEENTDLVEIIRLFY